MYRRLSAIFALILALSGTVAFLRSDNISSADLLKMWLPVLSTGSTVLGKETEVSGDLASPEKEPVSLGSDTSGLTATND